MRKKLQSIEETQVFKKSDSIEKIIGGCVLRKRIIRQKMRTLNNIMVSKNVKEGPVAIFKQPVRCKIFKKW